MSNLYFANQAVPLQPNCLFQVLTPLSATSFVDTLPCRDEMLSWTLSPTFAQRRITQARGPPALPVPAALRDHLNKEVAKTDSVNKVYTLAEIPPIPEHGKEPFCEPKPSSDWFRFSFAFYALFRDERCIFAQCLDTCNRNRADLIFPRNPAELSMQLAFANRYAGDVFFGLYLPFDYNTSVACQKHECNKFLKYTNGSTFVYHSWMGDMFDRAPGQDHCYVAPGSGTYKEVRAVPATCLWNAGFACMALCPIPGPVVKPTQLLDMPVSLPRLYNNIDQVLRKTRTKDPEIQQAEETFMTVEATQL